MTSTTQQDDQGQGSDGQGSDGTAGGAHGGAGPARRSPVRRWTLVAAVVVAVGAVAWLAFGWFGVQGLFLDDEVNEAAPAFESGAQAEPGDLPTTVPPATAPSAPPATTPTTSAPAAPVIEVVAAGDFVSLDHATSGRASVLTDGTDQRFLRLEGFATDNGPDLDVYLTTTAPDGEESTFDDDFVDLGDLQGNVGDQNYEIPAGVDLDRYTNVVIWCVRFASAFGAAPLA